MNIYDLITLAIIAAIIMIIVDHINTGRIAKLAAKRYCEQHNLQFLDQNVVLEKLRPCRSKQRLFGIKRTYRFEFSSIGDYRYQGKISLISKRVASIELDAYKTQDDFLE